MLLRQLFGYLRETITWSDGLKFVLFEVSVVAAAIIVVWLTIQTRNIYVFTAPFGLAIALFGVKIARVNRDGVRRIGEKDWSSKYVLLLFGVLGAIIAISPLFLAG